MVCSPPLPHFLINYTNTILNPKRLIALVCAYSHSYAYFICAIHIYYACAKCTMSNSLFWRARVCWPCPLLCLCRPFCIFERCLDSNLESCRNKQARYQLELSHPSPSHLFLPEAQHQSIGNAILWIPSLSRGHPCRHCPITPPPPQKKNYNRRCVLV